MDLLMLWRSSWWRPEQNYHSLMLWVLVGGRPGWFLVNLTQSRITREEALQLRKCLHKIGLCGNLCCIFSNDDWCGKVHPMVSGCAHGLVVLRFWESRLNKSWQSSILPWSLHQPFPLCRFFFILVEFLPPLPSVIEYDVRLKNWNKNVFSLSCFLSWSFITAIEMLARIKIWYRVHVTNLSIFWWIPVVPVEAFELLSWKSYCAQSSLGWPVGTWKIDGHVEDKDETWFGLWHFRGKQRFYLSHLCDILN